MQLDSPSETALRAARARAQHQIDEGGVVLKDPLSPTFMAACGVPKPRGRREAFIARTFRSGIVARSRIAEDTLSRAVARGVQQYVILGAGLDTFGLRNPHPGLRVFEVDHPATQAFKRQLMSKAGMQSPGSTVFVPLDLQQGSLWQALETRGWDAKQPTFFSWLGVIWYLEREAAMQTLKSIAACPAGSVVVFDCWHQPASLDWGGRLKLFMLRRRYARMGEPWSTLFGHEELRGCLQAAGFSEIAQMDSQAINEALMAPTGTSLRLRGGKLYSVNVAWV